jgi:hypothetical protein
MPDLSKEIHNILYIYKHQFRDGKNALYIWALISFYSTLWTIHVKYTNKNRKYIYLYNLKFFQHRQRYLNSFHTVLVKGIIRNKHKISVFYNIKSHLTLFQHFALILYDRTGMLGTAAWQQCVKHKGRHPRACLIIFFSICSILCRPRDILDLGLSPHTRCPTDMRRRKMVQSSKNAVIRMSFHTMSILRAFPLVGAPHVQIRWLFRPDWT